MNRGGKEPHCFGPSKNLASTIEAPQQKTAETLASQSLTQPPPASTVEAKVHDIGATVEAVPCT
jgi:hypothetical protein